MELPASEALEGNREANRLEGEEVSEGADI